jgi:carboxymethylenebutenolidase
MRGEMVSLGGGAGYYVPSVKGRGKAVVVLHEWWGLSGHMRDVAERFAEVGYSALAPDFFHGKHVGDVDTASELMLALTEKDVMDVFREVWGYLSKEPTVEWGKAGVVGFGMGGAIALYVASVYPEVVGACVTFYGIHPNIVPVWSSLKAPVLAFFGGQDGVISEQTRKDFARRLQHHGVPYQEVVYPMAEHGFFNDDRPEVYDAEASADAWARLLKFLTLHLDWREVPAGEL